MIRQKELCVECYHGLSDPICIDCLKRELIIWLRDIGVGLEIQKRVLFELKKHFNNYDEAISDMNCVICGKQNISVCAYCFTRYVYLILKKIEVNGEISSDFLETFTYWKRYEEFKDHDYIVIV